MKNVTALLMVLGCHAVVLLSQDISGKYVCCLKAVKSEREASTAVGSFATQGVKAGYLWIPDYDGLSGKEFFLVYGGPFDSKSDANAFLDEVRVVLGDKGFYIKNVGRKAAPASATHAGSGEVRRVESSTPTVPQSQYVPPSPPTAQPIVPAQVQPAPAQRATQGLKKSLYLKIDGKTGAKKP